MLQKYNVVPTLVETGTAAVEACRSQSYDLILMDCMMPEMDGYGAATHIRALPDAWCKTVPIVALTANALQHDRERCLLAGMSDYVTKPIRRAELNDALRRAMNVAVSGRNDSQSQTAVA
jgi:CheY-like chemotaxis protein